MSNVMGIYVKFTMTTHQICSIHVTPASNSKNFNFSPNSILNFRKSYQIWGKLAQEQKVTGKKTNWGWKTPPSPRAYRVKVRIIRVISERKLGRVEQHNILLTELGSYARFSITSGET